MQHEDGVSSNRSTTFGLQGDAVVHRGLQLGRLKCVLRHRALPMAQGCGDRAQCLIIKSSRLTKQQCEYNT